MEHQQMILNSPDQDHSRSENPGTSTQIAQSEGILSQRRVQVTVLRAHNVPKIPKRFRLKNQYFVAVTDQATTKKTASVSIKGQTVQWDQTFDAFSQPSSRLKFCLYAKRLAHPDTLIGMHETPIPAESQIDIPFTLSNGDGQNGQSVQPVILYLTIAVSANATSHPVLPINPANAIATKVDVSPMERATKPTIAQDSIESVPFVFATAPEPPSPPTDHAPTETSTSIPTVPDVRATVSPAENALHDADEATKAINLSSTWEGAVARIKWVVDTVSPVAELHPYAKMACGLLLAIPKTILEQFQSDGNVRTLLAAMHDAFDFANQEDILKSIKRESKQAQSLRSCCSMSVIAVTSSNPIQRTPSVRCLQLLHWPT
ncbi:hypothetical protein EDB84DRAFT_1582735 [Lactarius hengduanensis]|nr:hypothetical protein EDB84DRAFT_1582735 [Lactarius hengduanensis]